jgi:DNA polymerase-3 subunit delta
MKYNRTSLNKLYHDIDQGNLHPVYLLFGERYLCTQAAGKLASRLLAKNEAPDAILKIDGDQEDISDTMNKLRTFSLFGTKQVIMVTDSRLFHSRAVGRNIWNKAKKNYTNNNIKKTGDYLARLASLGNLSAGDTLEDLSAGQWKTKFGFPRPTDWHWAAKIELPPLKQQESSTDGADIVIQTLENGVPESNHLIILAETVDKRKKLFKLLEKQNIVVDLSVDTSLSTAARKEQTRVLRELINNTFTDMGKRPGPGVVEMLLERTGFHPVAAVHETEKLCLYADETTLISTDDVKKITCETSEKALFELNEAFTARNLSRTLMFLKQLLQAGIHPLAVIATLRNLIHKLLFFRALQDQDTPKYQRGQQYNVFQHNYLPEIKEKTDSPDYLKGHPFAVYKGFQQAERFDQGSLKLGLKNLLDAEFNLKNSRIQESLILENFFLTMLL